MVRIGTSGWSYRHWRGTFYPANLPLGNELDHVVEKFDTVEINRTFYSLARPSWFRDWYQRAPADFRYAVKGSRFITHMKGLKGVEVALANFFASGLLELRQKLGPLLWQLPAGRSVNLKDLEAFCASLPRTMGELADMARNHRLTSESSTESHEPRQEVRHALEFRREPVDMSAVIELLSRHDIAMVSSHSSHWPCFEEGTSQIRYVRLQGPGRLYDSVYSPAELEEWARRLREWSGSGDVDDIYVYFDNDGHGSAPQQAVELRRLLESANPRGGRI